MLCNKLRGGHIGHFGFGAQGQLDIITSGLIASKLAIREHGLH